MPSRAVHICVQHLHWFSVWYQEYLRKSIKSKCQLYEHSFQRHIGSIFFNMLNWILRQLIRNVGHTHTDLCIVLERQCLFGSTVIAFTPQSLRYNTMRNCDKHLISFNDVWNLGPTWKIPDPVAGQSTFFPSGCHRRILPAPGSDRYQSRCWDVVFDLACFYRPPMFSCHSMLDFVDKWRQISRQTQATKWSIIQRYILLGILVICQLLSPLFHVFCQIWYLMGGDCYVLYKTSPTTDINTWTSFHESVCNVWSKVHVCSRPWTIKIWPAYTL